MIVGAGIGGLVAGIALSKKGHKVTILEAAGKLGEVFPLKIVVDPGRRRDPSPTEFDQGAEISGDLREVFECRSMAGGNKITAMAGISFQKIGIDVEWRSIE